MRVATYLRISQDRTAEGRGVERQREDVLALVERRGWTLVGDPIEDDDTSAAGKKERPGFERLLTMLAAREVDGVVAWAWDRLERNRRDSLRLIEVGQKVGAMVALVRGSDIDMSTPAGRLSADILASVARHEIDAKSDRQKRANVQAAADGKVSGGGLRAFGYAEDRVTIVPDEAAVIREVSARALAGESLNSIAHDLGDRGVTTTQGNPWRVTTLRRMLAAARISGRREHIPSGTFEGARPLLGEIVGTAIWPAIISVEESDRLRTLLADPVRRRAATGRSYLLSGILRCGYEDCDSGLVGRPRDGVRRYVCARDPGRGACGKIAVVADFADEVIRDMCLVALESPDFRERLYEAAEVDPAVRQSVTDDERQLEELAAEYGARRISMGEWRTAREIVEARLERNRRALDAVSDVAALDGMEGSYDDLLAHWRRRNMAQQRAIVEACMTRVPVLAATRKRDVDRFRPVWRV